EFVELAELAGLPRPARQETIARTQLPALAGVSRRAAQLPGVFEVLEPHESGTGNVEVHFAAPDPAAAADLNARLHALARPSR
ncbi:MAG: hypothetical protein QOF58_6555, partial [Pseudonocardiales bacterium]|nr:hypothetical protein [Pseudonocardiales bacterium]